MRHAILRATPVALCLALSACSGDEAPPSAPSALAPPVVQSPSPGDEVRSPLAAQGTAPADQRVALSVVQNGATIGSASGLVDGSGRWTATIALTGAAAGPATLSAETVAGGQRSAPVRVSVTLADDAPPAGGLTVTQPRADDVVVGEVDVSGTASPEAAVRVEVLVSSTPVGSATAVASATGRFAVTVNYDGSAVAPGQTLTVKVTQTTSDGAGDPVTVAVVHQAPSELSGSVSDPVGHPGASVHVRAYPATADGLDWADEVILSVTDGAPFEALAFELRVPPGDYVVRAFRDAGGAHDPDPDGHPTLGVDAQSAPRSVTAGAAAVSVSLPLSDPVTPTRSPYFDVFTRHESAEPYPPRTSTPGPGGTDRGLCGGFFLRIIADPQDSRPQHARLPDGTIVALADDGGCDFGGDNRASSYDDRVDGRFSYGIQDPSDDLAGEYRYAVHDGDHIGVLTDRLDALRRMPRRTVLLAPTGAARVQTLRPTLEWTAVPEAAGYRVHVWSPSAHQGFDAAWVRRERFTLPQDLPDGAYVDVRIDAADGDRAQGEDVDAEAAGPANRFVVDLTGDRSVRVQGSIFNAMIDLEANIRVEAGTDFEASSSVWLPPTATEFSLVALRGSGNGYVEAFLDVAGTGERDGPNRAHSTGVENLDFRQDVAGLSLELRQPIMTVAPAQGAVVTDQPSFSWEPYPPAPATYSWVVFVEPEDERSDGAPPNLYGVPDRATQLTLGQTSGVRDVGLLARCLMGGPAAFDVERWTCRDAVEPSLERLAPGPWRWGVVLVECDYDAPDYAMCLGELLGSSEPTVMSMDVPFSVQ